MNVEAVAWISARSSGLYLGFGLAALLCHLKHIEAKQDVRFLLASLGFFVLALCSKAQAVLLPVLMLLLDLYAGRTLDRRAIVEKVPFFALSVVFGLVTISERGTVDNITQGMLSSFTVLDLFFMATYALTFYPFKCVFPVHLAAIYLTDKTGGHLPIAYYLSFPAALLGAYLGYRAARARRYVWFGLLFFLIGISLNIQIIPSRLFVVADRYAYLPFVGLFFIVGHLYCEVRDDPSRRRWHVPFTALLVVALGVFSVASYQRTDTWKDSVTLVTDLIEKNAHVPYLYRAYGTRGNEKLRSGAAEEALTDFSRALELNPEDATTFYNRAVAYKNLGRYQAAMSDLDRALALGISHSGIYNLRCYVKFSAHDLAGALRECDKALELDPQLFEALNTRAVVRFASGDPVGAEADFNRAETPGGTLSRKEGAARPPPAPLLN